MTRHEAKAYWSILTYPTYTRQPARRLPVLFAEGGDNFYPETQDDILGGPKKNVDYNVIILENEHVKLTIMPEIGGKIWSVFDKNSRKETVFVPDVIKPGLIWSSGAWIPGGMEFNFPFGHTIYAMRPVPCAIFETGPNLASAVVQRTCIRNGMRMEVVISLRPNEARFSIDYTLSNPSPLTQKWYQWTNVGVATGPKWRFFSKAKWFSSGTTYQSYPIANNGKDTSWCVNRDWPSDAFMLGHREDFFGYFDYDRDIGLCHVAPWQKLRGKKYFTWGFKYMDHSPSMFSDKGLDYLEIQTGPMETQGCYDFLKPGEGRNINSDWIPYRTIGGIEWANRDLIFNVHEGKAWLYPAVNLDAKVVIAGRAFSKSLEVGKPVQVPGGVSKGDKVEIFVNGKLERSFNYPLEGNQEPNAEKRLKKEFVLHPYRKPVTLNDWLTRARHEMIAECFRTAVRSYRKILKMKPRHYEARLKLADALWHMGEFDAGEKELRKLLKHSAKADAQAVLLRRPRAEALFMKPVLAVAEGPARDLALAERYAGYGNHDAALKLYRKLEKSQPKNWRVHFGLARYYLRSKYDKKKLVEHAVKALTLLSGDRDLLIELLPPLHVAGRHDLVVKYINSAPAAVRELTFMKKVRAASYLELGELDKCWQVINDGFLHIWEGEPGHVETYRNCAIAMIERALRHKNIKEARKMADCLNVLPDNLCVNRRSYDTVRPALWDGIVTAVEGKMAGAKDIWRKAIADMQTELDEFAAYSDMPFWAYFTNEEIMYAFGMCATLLGDRAAISKVNEYIDVRNKFMWEHRWVTKVSDYMQAVSAELKGDFAEAAKCFKHHLKTAGGGLYLAKLHLTAIEQGKRRGEWL